ncbi:MAG: hypothetical protein H7230_04265 [Candidatus Parcubacteria bacterium]|nr:hypothetical protein [Candidatus Paceibacterota bacterium]
MAEIAKPLANKVKYLSTLLGVVASLLTFNPQGALGAESGPVEKLILGTQSQQVHPDEIALQNQLKEFGLSTTWAVFSSDFIWIQDGVALSQPTNNGNRWVISNPKFSAAHSDSRTTVSDLFPDSAQLSLHGLNKGAIKYASQNNIPVVLSEAIGEGGDIITLKNGDVFIGQVTLNHNIAYLLKRDHPTASISQLQELIPEYTQKAKEFIQGQFNLQDNKITYLSTERHYHIDLLVSLFETDYGKLAIIQDDTKSLKILQDALKLPNLHPEEISILNAAITELTNKIQKNNYPEYLAKIQSELEAQGYTVKRVGGNVEADAEGVLGHAYGINGIQVRGKDGIIRYLTASLSSTLFNPANPLPRFINERIRGNLGGALNPYHITVPPPVVTGTSRDGGGLRCRLQE